MKEKNKKGSKRKIIKIIFLYVCLPVVFGLLVFGLFFIYNLPYTVSDLIRHELNKYDFGPYSIEAIAVRHNRAVLGPIEFGSDDNDKLKVVQVELNYTFAGIRNGEIESINISGADLHLNQKGNWQLAGLEGILRGIANYQKAHPSDSTSKMPEITVDASTLTLHYLKRQYSFPLSIEIDKKDGIMTFTVSTNLSRDKIQKFIFKLNPEDLSLELNLESFNLDLAQAGHFLQRFGMKNARGNISVTNIGMAVSQEEFNLNAWFDIQNFKAVYKDGENPVTLTFDKVEPIRISRDLRDLTANFRPRLHFYNLTYSYGTYLFHADEIKSKVDFNIYDHNYKTDSHIKKINAQIDGSDINSLSEIDLKLYWEGGELSEYAASGEADFSYSRGLIKGKTKVEVESANGNMKINGSITDLKLPDGKIDSGTFNYSDLNDSLSLSADVKNFSVLSGALKGNSRFSYKKEDGLVNISGDIEGLTLLDQFHGSASVKLNESEDSISAALNNFKLRTQENFFEIAFSSDINIPGSFDDFINNPKAAEVTTVNQVSSLGISNYKISPFNLKASGNRDAVNFELNRLESANLPLFSVTELKGRLNLKNKESNLKFNTQINSQDYLPAFKGKFNPVKVEMKIREINNNYSVDIKETLPLSQLKFQKGSVSFETAVTHENSLQIQLPANEFMKGEVSAFKARTSFNFKNVKSGKLQIDSSDIVVELENLKPLNLQNYMDLSFEGRLRSSANSISFGLIGSTAKERAKNDLPKWKEALEIKKLSSDLPFNWSLRSGFKDTEQSISLGSLSYIRWVDGGSFLGWFPKSIISENLDLTGIVKGLQVEMEEEIRLSDKLTVNFEHITGWEIPEAVVNATSSPIPFLAKLILTPGHQFNSKGSIELPKTDINDIAAYIQEPFSEDELIRGSVSAQINFEKDRKGLKMPATLEIDNLRGYIIKGDERYKFKNIRGKVKMKSLLTLESEDGQFLRIGELSIPGIELHDTEVKFKLYSPQKLRLMRLRTHWCGGLIEGSDILMNPAYQTLRCTLHASDVQMQKIMELMKGVNSTADGSLFGRINLEVKNGKITNQDGFLFSEPDTKMSLQLREGNLIYDSISDKRTRKLLQNLNVEYFKIRFKGGEMKEHKTHFSLKGTSALGDPPNPLDLSINLNGPVIYYLQLPLSKKGIQDLIKRRIEEKK